MAIALGVAQGGMSYVGQKQAAKTQAKVQRNATIAEQQRQLQELSSIRIRERQEMIASAQQRQEITKQAREARATARVSAGEAGVAGLSVDALIDSFTQKEANALFSLTQQEQFNAVERQLGIQDSQMRSRMNLLSINRPIEQPNLLGSVLDGASTALSGYSAMTGAGFGQGSRAASTAGSTGYGTVLKPPSGGFPSNNNYSWALNIGK